MIRSIKFFMFLVLLTSAAFGVEVESRTSEIQIYNSQVSAKTVAELCNLLNQSNIDMGKKATIKCKSLGRDVIEMRASLGTKSVAVLAKGSDKVVLEFSGSDEIHTYLNNLGQFFNIKFDFVNTGVRTRNGITVAEGTYRLDAVFKNSKESIRAGYYINSYDSK